MAREPPPWLHFCSAGARRGHVWSAGSVAGGCSPVSALGARPGKLGSQGGMSVLHAGACAAGAAQPVPTWYTELSLSSMHSCHSTAPLPADGPAVCGCLHAGAGRHRLDEQPRPAERSQPAHKGGAAVILPCVAGCWGCCVLWGACNSHVAKLSPSTQLNQPLQLQTPSLLPNAFPERLLSSHGRRCSWTGGSERSCLPACWWTMIGR